MRRGGVRTVPGAGDDAGKPGPAVLVQDDVFGAAASITVWPLTSGPAGAALFRLEIEPDARAGLKTLSRILAGKVTAVGRAGPGLRLCVTRKSVA